MNYKNRQFALLAPVIGIFIFFICYFIAAGLYPGGSAADPEALGFSFRNNYWCNLLNNPAINGKANPGKSFAVAGMFFLCGSLTIFWMMLPLLLSISNPLKIIQQRSAAISMCFTLLLAVSNSHDLIVNLAAATGIVALICTLIILFKKQWRVLFVVGVGNILIIILNNIFYYSEDLISFLPVIQKFSFMFFLGWIIAINLRIRKEIKPIRNTIP